MGTNYYLHRSTCDHCNRSDPLHIGKSSGGWTFTFRGYRNDWDEPRIASYADWLAYLTAAVNDPTNHIRNEYGEEVSLEAFVRLVESKRREDRNHTLYCRVSHPEHAARECWLDDEGHSFTGNEFS